MITKKQTWKLGIFLCSIITLWLALNLEATTKQGINYQVRELKLPLYLKILNFFDRHYNYKWLVKRIVHDKKEENEKAKLIFHWTATHIKKQPHELDIIDDHVWHIIVRGYGIDGQDDDVCATLFNYAGFKALLLALKGSSGSVPNHIGLTAVHFNNGWHICDPYRHIAFVNKQGQWATINEIVSGNWKLQYYNDATGIKDSLNYEDYFQSLKTIDFNALYKGNRSAIQDPVSRLLHFFRTKGQ